MDNTETEESYGHVRRDINILVGVTGSVATIKLPLLLQELIIRFNLNDDFNLKLRVVSTEHAKHFFKEEDLPHGMEVFTDQMEWESWQQRGDPVVHIELAKWADVMLIAPLDANTLAKISQGICDNLLTCIARAWHFGKPLLFCPAMNTDMWEHSITSEQVAKLKEWSYQEVPCIIKTLICGDHGRGAMAEVGTIVDAVHKTVMGYFYCIND